MGDAGRLKLDGIGWKGAIVEDSAIEYGPLSLLRLELVAGAGDLALSLRQMPTLFPLAGFAQPAR